MRATVLKPIRVKSTGETFCPGEVIDLPEEKALAWAEKGLVSIEPDQTERDQPIPEAGHKTQIQALPERVDWESPAFGRLSGGPVLEMSETTFTLIHPLTGEKVTLSKEWLMTLDERAAILEYDAGLSREEADRKARGMLFNQFRKGGGKP